MSVTSGKSKVRHIPSTISRRTLCGRIWTDEEPEKGVTCPECLNIQAKGHVR